MCRKRHFVTRVFWIVSAFATSVFVVEVLGQVPERPAPRPGEVTGNDVYVRSGPSSNHYPICKLNAGKRVTIVGERGDWYEILPPEGTFSLISGDYVDTADNKSGVVNGNNVRVRAGSTLNQNKYTVQTMLSKGARVTILGRSPEGFLRIKPPSGATLWVNRDFVEFMPVARPEAKGETDGMPGSDARKAKAKGAATGAAAKDAAETVAGEAETSPLAAAAPTAQRRELQEIDAAARAELAKPVLEREFGALLERYQAVADGQSDEFARLYARARIEQISSMAALVETVSRIRRLNEETDSKRREYLEGRAKIREILPPIPAGIDAQGELQVSALYPPGSLPRRYRLVDPSGPKDRTIGYVEIPQDSTLDVDAFLGRYVGVRASAKRLQTGGVNAVPVYLASELVLLQPTAATTVSLEDD